MIKSKIRKNYYNTMRKMDGDKDTLIIAIGDSWTKGVGVAPNNCPNYKVKFIEFVQSFPNQLAKLMNAHCINMGKGGASNTYIYHSLVEMIPAITRLKSRYTRIIIIPTYTVCMRTTEWFNGASQPDDINFFDIDEMKKHHPREYSYYVENMNNHRKFEFESYNAILNVQTLCALHELECYMGFSFGPVLEKINIHENQELNDYDFLRFTQSIRSQLDWSNNVIAYHNNNEYYDFVNYLLDTGMKNFSNAQYYFTKCLHPTAEGHVLIAKIFYNFIKD